MSAAAPDRVFQPVSGSARRRRDERSPVWNQPLRHAAGLFGLAEVAGSDRPRLARAQHELARRAGRQLGVVDIDDARLEARLHASHRAVGRGVAIGGDDEVGLGRAIALEQAHAGTRLERARCRRRHARPEANAHAVRALGRASGCASSIGTIAPSR
jgi:hypothetical protein